MRFNNQFVVKIINSVSKMNGSENLDVTSELSENSNERIHSNNSTMKLSDTFSWNRPEPSLSKITESYSIHCEDGESANIENNDFQQAPSSK